MSPWASAGVTVLMYMSKASAMRVTLPLGEVQGLDGGAAPDPADAAVDEQQADEDNQHAQKLDGQDGFIQDQHANDDRRDWGDERSGRKIGGADARQDAVHDLEREGG